ncbi:MAG: hypothetical protein J0H39_01730 [Alphaproteobacteria bacterium]|nr:hypothetical protein [Alphaproteobacteria bacterium]
MTPILVYARDPGAANQMVAACEILTRDPADPRMAPLRRSFGAGPDWAPAPRIHARGPALDTFARAGFAVTEGAPADAALAQAAAVLTGLDDVDDPVPRALWRAARAARKPCAAICDNDVNLAVRLGDAQGCPDLVFAVSERGRREIESCRLPGLRVELVPDLHLARLARAAPDPEARARQRRRWGVSAEARVWLYAGVVRRELAALRAVEAEDEVDCLRALALALSVTEPASALAVRPHPRDPDGKYESACEAIGTRAVVDRSGTPAEAFAASDVVVSLSEAVRNEARLLGRPAYAPEAALALLSGPR